MIRKLEKKYIELPAQLRASFWFLVCSFLQKGITTITTPIFTRLLTTVEYGNYSVFNSWLSIVTIFVTLHLYSGIFSSGLVKFSEERSIFASSMQGLNLTLSVGWTVVYVLFRSYWNRLLNLTTVQMLAMLAMIWASSAFSFWAAEQRVDYKYRNLVLVTLLVSFFKPVVGIVFVILADDKVTARILGLTLVEIIGYTVLFISQMSKGHVFCSKKYWKYALRFGLPLVPHYLSQTVLNSADRIMILNMVGAGQAGIYSIAYSISQIMKLFNSSLSNTIGPWMYQKIKEKDLKPIGGITYLALGVVAVMNLLLIALAPELVALFAPKAYHEAIWVVPPVAMSVYLIFMYDFFSRFEVYYEKTVFMMVASILGAALNIALNYIFIKMFGYMAAGYTTLFCYGIYVICHYLAMRRICNDYLAGANAFEANKIVALSLSFFALGFLMMCTYKAPLIRYSLLIIGLSFGFIKRAYLKTQIMKILKVRKRQSTPGGKTI